MTTRTPFGGPTAKDDDTLSVGAVTDVELDSTGAGSPPPSRFERELQPDVAVNHHNIGFEGSAAGPTAHAATHKLNARPATLELALGDTLVISGGSGFNELVGATPCATYVMPISDNGGSSSEIIRVLGGPSIGDLRSRLTRLIPTPSRYDAAVLNSPLPPQSNEAIYNLLSYRLPSHAPSREIKQEWMDILEGRHRLWRGIEPERKEVIRGFLVHFESEVLRRAHRHFNFRGGSIGNFFLAAAQKFFRSIQSAIFLFSATTQISTSILASKVLPVINTNHTATIAAELEDGEMIVGQCEISHPAPKPQPRSGRVPRIALAPATLAVQQPGTPSSAMLESHPHNAEEESLLPAEAMGNGGLATPSFGPPAHYHVHETFDSNYTSMNASLDALKLNSSGSGVSRAQSSMAKPMPAKGGDGRSPLFARLVDERAAAHAAQARKGLTTVGNYKDGLDPADDDQDSQDGIDQADSPRESSAAEEEHHSDRLIAALTSAQASAGSNHSGEKTGNIIFSKAEDEDLEPSLPSRIRRILYVNAYRNEIYPAPNPSFVTALGRCQTLIYSCGSLWTSVVPCLALRNIATSIAASPSLRYKILLLNSVQDRETRGMDALGFISAICDSLNRSDQPSQESARKEQWKPYQLISHLVYFPEGQVKVDAEKLADLGIRCVPAETRLRSKNGAPKFDEETVRQALIRITTAPA